MKDKQLMLPGIVSGISKNRCPESAGINVRFMQEHLSGMAKNQCPVCSRICITIAGKNMSYNQTIPSTANVTLISNNYINLEPGFKVENGAVFNAFIDNYTFNQISNFKSTTTFPIDFNNLPHITKYQLIKNIDTLTYKSTQKEKIDENNHNDFLYIYPNPTKDYIIVEFNNNDNVYYKLIDYTGRLRLNSMIDGTNSTIDISSLEAGLYILLLNIDNKKYTRLIIKN